MIVFMAASSVAGMVWFSASDFSAMLSVNMNQTERLVFPFSMFSNAGMIHDPQNSSIHELRGLARAKSRLSDGAEKKAKSIVIAIPDNRKSQAIGKNKIYPGSDHLSQRGKNSVYIIQETTAESSGQITTSTSGRTVQTTSSAAQTSTIRNETEMVTATEMQRKKKNVLITLCTVVLNDTAYIVEWIEFMRLQGVERFVIYDDSSADNITMLPEFYRQRDPTVEVIVLPAVFSGPVKSGWSYVDQKRNLQNCLDTYRDSTEWILISDADEFIYSPTYGSLRNVTVRADEMGVERNMSISTIYFPCARFGTGGQKKRFHYALSQTASGEIEYTNGCGIELIVDHIYRGRWHVHEDGGPSPAYCENPPHVDLTCKHGFGKSMFRARDVLAPDVHIPGWFREGVKDTSRYESYGLGFCNHYYIRSREEVEKKANNCVPSKYQPGMYMAFFDATDEAFYGRFDSQRGPFVKSYGTSGPCF